MFEVKIPKPLLVTVDDVGWWNGRDGSKKNQPFRTGMTRHHVPDDYRALAALGKALDMRIPAGFVLCEWDRTSLLRRLPSATWMGDRWQAPSINGVHKEEAAGILKNAASHIEPALHGLGHEFWIDGRVDRSEFHSSSGRMRHSDEVKKHLEYFFKLLVRNDLDSNIRLFIPPALNHCFGDGDQGFQGIASSFGIRLVTLLFQRTRFRRPPQYENVGWECGVVAIDRGEAPIPWNEVAPVPNLNSTQGILPLHWSNILHNDPEKNMDVVTAWIKEINCKIKKDDWVPAKDITQFLTQFLNMSQSKIQKHSNTIVVDMDWIQKVPGSVLGDSVFFTINTSSPINIFGAEKFPSTSPREKRFLKLGLPESGRIVFQFCRAG